MEKDLDLLLGLKKTATEIAQRTQAELSLGHFEIYTHSEKTISFKELTQNFLSSKRNHIRAASIKRYQNYLDKFIGYMEKFFPDPALNIKEIKSSYIEESFNYFLENEITNSKKWEPKTVNGLRAILIQLFQFGIKQFYITTNPVKDTKKFRENGKDIVEFYTDEELKKIWKELDQYWVDPLKFIVHTGLRKGEWINLKWNNVNFSDSSPAIIIMSSATWRTKTAEQKGTKIVTSYNVKVVETKLESPLNEINKNSNDNFYELVLAYCRDAVRIQNELGGLMYAKSLAVTLFIVRSKINQNGYS